MAKDYIDTVFGRISIGDVLEERDGGIIIVDSIEVVEEKGKVYGGQVARNSEYEINGYYYNDYLDSEINNNNYLYFLGALLYDNLPRGSKDIVKINGVPMSHSEGGVKLTDAIPRYFGATLSCTENKG